jgi:beta-glucosidase
MKKRFQVLPAALLALALATYSAAQFGPTPKPKGPWMNKSLSPDERADLVLAQMTFEEKIQMVHGAGMFFIGPTDPSLVRSNGGGGFVPGIERLGIPDLNMDDSSVGVGGGARKGRYSTALPSTLALASSWDPKLAREYGDLIGRELSAQGYNVSLGGGVDIMREPRNGRNFEYQGEDPILAGNMDAELIQGIQEQGVVGDIKHYALNDSETGRYFSNSIADKRTMRETDLLAFEIGVKKAHPGMVMCSYNLVNGVYACENGYLLNDVLKKDWGFQGWVVSDWLATHSTTRAALAGLDQEQPGFSFYGSALKKAVVSGEVPMARLNDMVHRILRTEFAIGIVDNPPKTGVPDVFGGLEIAQRVAERSIVLLKNENGQLPLRASVLHSIAVIGSHADAGVLSGGGSAQVDPAGGNAVPQDVKPGDLIALFTTQTWHRSSPLKAIQAHIPNAHVVFNTGDVADSAVELAKSSDVAIVFVTQHAHEGGDVASLAVSRHQNELVEAVAAANSHTIVVIESGGPIAMPWVGRVSGILEAWYPGIRGGEAIANILFGEVNPSAKLAATFAKSDSDLPHVNVPAPPGPAPGPLDGIDPPKPPFDVPYSEGLKVGYKWFDAENKQPLFPFGYGLSYTTFAYTNLQVNAAHGLEVTWQVRNTGSRAGAEIAQVYLSFPAGAGEPPKRLVGWEKVDLAVGETKTVKIVVDPLYLSVFDVDANHWKVEPGEYKVMAGASSRDLPLTAGVRF